MKMKVENGLTRLTPGIYNITKTFDFQLRGHTVGDSEKMAYQCFGNVFNGFIMMPGDYQDMNRRHRIGILESDNSIVLVQNHRTQTACGNFTKNTFAHTNLPGIIESTHSIIPNQSF